MIQVYLRNRHRVAADPLRRPSPDIPCWLRASRPWKKSKPAGALFQNSTWENNFADSTGASIKLMARGRVTPSGFRKRCRASVKYSMTPGVEAEVADLVGHHDINFFREIEIWVEMPLNEGHSAVKSVGSGQFTGDRDDPANFH